MHTPTHTTDVAADRPLPAWQQTLARLSPILAGFTTLCCLGLPALVAFASAIGATFLTHDATLRPILIVTLLLTLAGSWLTYRRHRNPAPLTATAIAAVMIYWPLYGPDLADHMTDSGTGHGGAHRPGSSPWVIAGLVVLIAAQAFDIWQQRRRRARNVTAPAD